MSRSTISTFLFQTKNRRASIWKRAFGLPALSARTASLRGTVEVDECFVGGKEANKHEHKKLKAGRASVGKVAVLGMRERGGRTHAMVVPDTGLATIQNEIHGAVEPGTQLYTDEHGAYSDQRLTYRRLIA